MSEYFIYRMTSDTGNAPCVYGDLLTLACCKGGQLRYYKNSDKITPVHTGLRHSIGKLKECSDTTVYVMGIKKERVIYVAEITRCLTMEEYFSSEEFQKRQDCIYECFENQDEQGNVWKLKRRKNFNNRFHGYESQYSDKGNKDKQFHCDELGDYVLLSSNFSYYGNGTENSVLIPDNLIELMPKHQESKHYSDNNSIDKFFKSCLKDSCRAKNPTDKLTCKNGCQR